MTRIDELQEKYPHMPREVIAKLVALSQGIRDTEALDKVSVWTRGGSYQSRDMDISMKEIAEKRPWTVRPGYIMRPKGFTIRNGVGAAIWRASDRSPYEVRDLSDGKFALYEGNEKVDDICFPDDAPPNEEIEQAVTSKGTAVTELVQCTGTSFSIQAVRFCEYFTRGEQCRFCNYNSTYQDARAIGTAPPITIDLDDTVEAYKIVSSKVKLFNGHVQMGGFRSSEQEAKIHIDFIGNIAKAAPYTPHINISTQATDRENLQSLKDAGLASGTFPMEAWGAEMFPYVAPGKAKYRGGFEGYKQFFLDAVEVLGAGNVASNFVAGASLMGPNGHKTWQEARDCLVEGFRWLIKNGVLATFIPIRLGIGSMFGDDKSNWAKLPPAEFFLDLAQAHHEAMMEYGLYPKMNRVWGFVYAGANYAGEIGMVTMAGSVENFRARLGASNPC